MLEKEPATHLLKNTVARRGGTSRRKIKIHCIARPARRAQFRRTLPPRGDRPEPLLPLIERLSRGGEEATGWRDAEGLPAR